MGCCCKDEQETHVHVHVEYDDTEILATLARMEEKMSALSDAVAGVATRVNDDFNHLHELLDAALATDAADAAEIARLKGEADTVAADMAATIDALNAIDPDADFPAPVEEPVEEPAPVEEPVEEPAPVEEPPAEEPVV